jgi:hypothetical protein
MSYPKDIITKLILEKVVDIQKLNDELGGSTSVNLPEINAAIQDDDALKGLCLLMEIKDY